MLRELLPAEGLSLADACLLKCLRSIGCRVQPVLLRLARVSAALRRLRQQQPGLHPERIVERARREARRLTPCGLAPAVDKARKCLTGQTFTGAVCGPTATIAGRRPLHLGRL